MFADAFEDLSLKDLFTSMLNPQSYGSSPSSLEYARLAVLAMLMVFACIFIPKSGYAATITVTVSVDDIIPNGNCTLREAILAANTNAAVDMCAAGEENFRDYIIFNVARIDITFSEIIISSDLDVVGQISIFGNGNTIFNISGGSDVNIHNVIFWKAAVAVKMKFASVGIFDCIFIYNETGIQGELTNWPLQVHNSTFLDNFLGIEYRGTPGQNLGRIEIHNSSFDFNKAVGIDIDRADFLITGSEILKNGRLREYSVKVGGIFIDGASGAIVNSTISQNEAVDASEFIEGGGIVADVRFGSGLEIRNSTITLNRPVGIDGSLLVSMYSTIVANNETDLRGTINSDGYNIIGNVSNDDANFVPTIGDQVGTSDNPIDPGLEPLADNGGKTRTHALMADSPAIDTGSCFDLLIDQRGYSNPGSSSRAIDLTEYPNFSDGCDVGAFELGAVEVAIDHPEDQPNPVKGFIISNSYPNPFSNTASFTLTLRQPQYVRVEVYDLIGRLVAVLYEGRLEAGNNHSFEINGQNLSNGLYFYRVVGETFSTTKAAIRTE